MTNRIFGLASSILKRLKGSAREARPIVLSAKGECRGCVAISYITWPFREGLDSPLARGHTNGFEVLAMAQSWQNLGFRVEIVDWKNRQYQPPDDCLVAIDIDRNLERWSPLLSSCCMKIFHATGPTWIDVNRAELGRLQSIRERKGVTLQQRRYVQPFRAAEVADEIVVLGNAYTVSTFGPERKNVTRIPISSAYEFDWPGTREWASAKKKFLWISSYGMVWKGLDLVLDAFAGMPELQLTVCGRPEKEDDFFSLYRRELLETPNISLRGWMDMASADFADLRRSHGSVVHVPSSEGGAGNVIHCMHTGLLPVCNYESSIDLADFGVFVEQPSVEAVRLACRTVAAMTDEEIDRRARAAYDHVRKFHTRDEFQKNYQSYAAGIAARLS